MIRCTHICNAPLVEIAGRWYHQDGQTVHDAEAGTMNNDLREVLAAYAHEAWAGWMDYLFSKGTHNADGSWEMPAWAVERWQRQARTPYAELSEQEKQSDRAEAVKILALLVDAPAEET
jgi:hypothetical protein